MTLHWYFIIILNYYYYYFIIIILHHDRDVPRTPTVQQSYSFLMHNFLLPLQLLSSLSLQLSISKFMYHCRRPTPPERIVTVGTKMTGRDLSHFSVPWWRNDIVKCFESQKAKDTTLARDFLVFFFFKGIVMFSKWRAHSPNESYTVCVQNCHHIQRPWFSSRYILSSVSVPRSLTGTTIHRPHWQTLNYW